MQSDAVSRMCGLSQHFYFIGTCHRASSPGTYILLSTDVVFNNLNIYLQAKIGKTKKHSTVSMLSKLLHVFSMLAETRSSTKNYPPLFQILVVN